MPVAADPSVPGVFRDSRGVVHTVSSSDPLDDLPGDVAAALAVGLLRPAERDLERALDRCEAVRELLERWQDAFFAVLPEDVDLEEEARWAAEAGLSLAELEAAYAAEDALEDDDALDLDDELDDELGGDDGLGTAAAGDAVADRDEVLSLDDLTGLTGLTDLDDPGEAVPVPGLVPDDLVLALERGLLLLPVRVRLEALVAAASLVATWTDLLVDHEKLVGHLVLAHGRPGSSEAHARLAGVHARLHADAGPGHDDPPGVG